MNWSVRQN